MTTIRSLAAEFSTEVHELAAFLDLGRDYDETADLDEGTEATYRDAWDAGTKLADEIDG